MEREPLYVCMTMDVERIRDFSPTGGPPDWAFAARSVRAYCDALAGRGMSATLFVVPDTALEQGVLLQQLAEETGAELALHMHPQCWKDHYLNPDAHGYWGAYTGSDQQAMLLEALGQIGDCLGDRPRGFRGGNFSANDETFRILTELGFTHGSISQPGRSMTRYQACWQDADPDVHFAHEAFRLIPGDLDFVEVPLTSDRERTEHWTGVGDVRIESASATEIAKAVRQEVGRQVGDDAPIKHVCLFTHNTVNYWSDDMSEKGRLAVLLQALVCLDEIAEDLGLEIRGTTIANVREAFLAAKGSQVVD
jgi:peptidoglycan/xylan/chitin deacetylase (PgdA/CDA1 family)